MISNIYIYEMCDRKDVKSCTNTAVDAIYTEKIITRKQ